MDIYNIFTFVSKKQLQLVLNGKSVQEHPVDIGVPDSSIPCPTVSYYILMIFLMLFCDNLPAILLFMLMILLSTHDVNKLLNCCNN